jgi:transposase-like protein
MVNPREKGKIPHAEWPAIFARYEKGESIASIARDYHCTAPAIRYIVRRQPAEAGTPAQTAVLETLAVAFPKSEPKDQAASRRPPRDGAPSSGGIPPDVHRRIAGEISLFLVALDTALVEDKPESLTTLRDATDKLMRAAARLYLELGR